MHAYRTKKNLWVAALALCFLTQTARVCRGQDACRADVDGDGQVTEADVAALVPVLFGELTFDPLRGTDVNNDGATTPADLTAILTALGLSCSTNPTPTATSLTPVSPTATPKPTTPGTATKTPATPVPTSTATPTRTPTRGRPTPTPTSACVVHQAHFGMTTDQLAITDCQAPFDGQLRLAKLYSIVGTPGTAITVDMQATGFPPPFIPSVLVVDADGQFVGALGSPPLQFVVTTTRPYLIFATSDKASPSQLGPYTLTLTSSACPTPLAIKINSSHGYVLGMPPPTPSLECPDPGAPALGGAPNPADLYTFTVSPAQVPLNMSIQMRQSNSNDDIDPFLSLIGPDGFELANDDDSGGFVGIGFDAEINFLAVQPGTYTIIATGGGGTGAYTLQLAGASCKGTTLANIPVDKPLLCPGQPGPGCQGTLYTTLSGGSPTTACAAPLPMPAFSPDSPDPSSPVDVYTFTATAGDVISVEMHSDDDARLYVFGPTSAGNPLVAQDDNSGPLGLTSDAQLAATLPLAGTYTIVAANDNALQPGDSPVSYTLFVQKCPAKGPLLNPSTNPSVKTNFNVFDCFGFGGVPFRSYAFQGTAGQFASVSMSSPDVDGFVRVFAPDGSRVENDDDLFNPTGSDARVNQILAQDGRYFIEVSSSPAQGAVNVAGASPSFTATVQTCATTTAVAGPINGVFQSTDCELSPGRKYDVYKFAPPAPRVASVLPPANGCAVALTAEGLQTPEMGCSTQLLEFPVLSSGPYGFMIAGTDATTRGAYSAQVKSCPLGTVGYGDARAGTLAASDCADAAGVAADWFLFRAPADLVQFNSGLSGSLQASFTPAAVLTDRIDAMSLVSPFSEDPSAMYPLGSDLAALFKVTGATPSDTGSYTLAIDPASFRQ